MRPNMQPVKSSNVAAIGYDGRSLHVQYKSSDRVYVHDGVPLEEFQRLLTSASIGSDMYRLKARYPARKG